MELRPCVVSTKKETFAGMFHKWCEKSRIVEPSPMIGGHCGGVLKYTVGLVEYLDGSVHGHYPEEIKFERDIKSYLSDGDNTLGELYDKIAMMSIVVLATYKDKAWKSKLLYNDRQLFGGSHFIAGVYTPDGLYVCYYEMKYWNMFNVEVLDRSPEYDEYAFKNADRLLSLLVR